MDRDARSFQIRIGSQFLRYPEYLGALLLAFVTLGVMGAFGVLRSWSRFRPPCSSIARAVAHVRQ